jgi:phenylalanyl-tRNA synthetase alpha chain
VRVGYADSSRMRRIGFLPTALSDKRSIGESDMSELDILEKTILQEIAEAADSAALEALRVRALGKKGSISDLMKSLGGLDPEERREKGALYNALRDRVSEALAGRRELLAASALNSRLAQEKIDISLPVPPASFLRGRVHPVSQVMDEIVAIFNDMGFAVAEGPDIETDELNFTALNIPPEHPARQMHDTFYFDAADAHGNRYLLRTHTSPVQIRTMRGQKPPHRIIAPGRTYRCDSDQTHTPMFHQVEGLAIDRDIHMGHLKWLLQEFARAFFEVAQVEMRFRPSYFPFTEPSAEVDIRCKRSGSEIRIGGGDDWLEILGCGMVHPKVLQNCGLDPEKWQGFAFGVGIDRLAMLKYGMPDLRAFFEADLRWLRHYGFSAFDLPTLAGGLSR